MSAQNRRPIYESGDWQVDLARRELRASGIQVPTGRRAFEIIEVLVQAAGELVTKDDLMRRVWSGAIVEENTLQVHISAVRKALGPDRDMLKTASRRGYRLLGNWTPRQEGTATTPVEVEPVRPQDQPCLTNLPMAASNLIGREAAARYIQDLLSAYRVVTLTGPGGIGKTALALQIARSLIPSVQPEAWLVELAALSDPGLVPSAVAGALSLEVGGDEISPESVARAIGGRKLLLVLDNCEHVIDAAAGLAETIVRMCPSTSVLATSREVLRIAGEYVYRVPPLDTPPPHQQEPSDVLGHSAVQVFIARTQALESDFVPHADALPVIAAVCRHLDGIPLAIEFAAACAATLGLRQLAARLDDRFGLLTSGRRTALPRHRTLRAMLDWSYELLPQSERHLLRRLAVFPGGFTLEAAIAVMRDTGHEASAVVDGIANLVAKSLVTLDGSAAAARWRLLETIRAYALEKLAESGEAARAARGHAEFFRDLMSSAQTGSALLPTTHDMARYGREIDNTRAALDWSFSAVGDPMIGVVLTAAYVPVWLDLALLVECRERTECALESLKPNADLSASHRMLLHMGLGFALVFTMGSVERARMALAKALEDADSLADQEAQLRALWAMWVLHFNIGECRTAQSITERFALIARRTGDQTVGLVADRLMGYALQHAGEQFDAQRCFERVLERYVARKVQRYTIWLQLDQRVLARAMLARVLWLQGHVEQAVDQAQLSLREAEVTDYKLSMCEALRLAVCPVALMTGDLAAAERSAALLIDLATSRNATLWRIVGRCLQGALLIKRGAFEAGLALLRTELDTCERTGWAIWYPEFLGVLAEGLAGLGRTAEGLAVIDRAIAAAGRGGERYYVAELLRIKGELLIQEAAEQPAVSADDCFHAALDIARQQGARFWELRAALSLARLRVTQDRRDDARQILSPVYDRFTEGFETADLRTARAMLDSLSLHSVEITK